MDDDLNSVKNNSSEKYEYKPGCVFCNSRGEIILAQNDYAFAVRDKFPATDLHSLIIPKRHVVGYFDLNSDEVLACNALLHKIKEEILRDDPSVEGFNVGVNCGLAAGQTVFHCHIHLIPRRIGDVADPGGGIRHAIGKSKYRSAGANMTNKR